MSSRKPAEFLAAQADAAERIKAGSPEPVKLPRTLSWKQIEAIPELFQQRHIEDEASAQHVQELARAIKRGPRGPQQDSLEAIVVFWMGDGWACVDGHHRLMAYAQEKHQAQVPVKALKGATLAQAVQLSLTANTRSKMPLTARCRGEAAWRMVVTKAGSRKEIASAAGVDESSVANMRKTLKAFTTAHPEVPSTEFTWVNMRHWQQGEKEPDGKDPTTRAAEQFLRRAGKHLKGLSVGALLVALDIHEPGMVAAIAEAHRRKIERPEQAPGYQALPFGPVEARGLPSEYWEHNPDF